MERPNTNPLLAFLAFTALIYTVNLQRRQLDITANQLDLMRQELGYSREELKLSREALQSSRDELKKSAAAQEKGVMMQDQSLELKTQELAANQLIANRAHIASQLEQARSEFRAFQGKPMRPTEVVEYEHLKAKVQYLEKQLTKLDAAASAEQPNSQGEG